MAVTNSYLPDIHSVVLLPNTMSPTIDIGDTPAEVPRRPRTCRAAGESFSSHHPLLEGNYLCSIYMDIQRWSQEPDKVWAPASLQCWPDRAHQ